MEQKAVELLSSLGVTTLRSVRTEVASLSGGQRQAVAIARSLLGDPKMVMLDEPTAALGIVQTAQILKLIQRLRERGLGVIVISHNLADVFEVADRIAVLRLGRVAGESQGRGREPRGRWWPRSPARTSSRGRPRRRPYEHARNDHRHRTGRGGRRVLDPQGVRRAGSGRPRAGQGDARDRGHLDDLPDRQRPLPERDQPLEPDAADRRHGDDLDRRRARPAAGRDRPLDRRRQRSRRRGDGGADRRNTAGRRCSGSSPGSAVGDRDRGLQRLHRHPVRRALVRGHARGTARLSGGALIRARRHRLGQPAAVDHHRPHQHLLRPGRSAGSSGSSGSSLSSRACWRCEDVERKPASRSDRCPW